MRVSAFLLCKGYDKDPDGHPILSDRDRMNPSLTALVERLRTSG